MAQQFFRPSEVATSSRVPPQAPEAEQSVLGGLLVDTRRWDEVSDLVKSDDFYLRAHKEIFLAVKTLQEGGHPVDVVTASEWLKNKGTLEQSGGLAYLGELANRTPGTTNVTAYARIVRERSVLRALLDAAAAISDKAYQPEGLDTEALIDFAEKAVFSISDSDRRSLAGFQDIQGLLTQAIDRIEDLFQSGAGITGVSTGFKDLDNQVCRSQI